MILVLLFLVVNTLSVTTSSSTQEVYVDPTIEKVLDSISDHIVESTNQNNLAVQENQLVPVIVTLKDDSATQAKDLEDRKEAIREKQEDVLEDLGITEIINTNSSGQADIAGSVSSGFNPNLLNPEETTSGPANFELERTYSSINAFAGNISAEGLEQLKSDPRVERIDYDYPIVPSLDASIPLINANDVWNLSVGGYNITGTGETICVIDTGVDYTHPVWGSCNSSMVIDGTCARVVGGYDYFDNDGDPRDYHSHGTHVAGIAASNDSTYRGVAPGAKIVALKVFNDAASSGSTSAAISAIDWCVSNSTKFNISVITMSIGVTDGSGAEIPYNVTCDASDSLAQKASWAASQGIFVDASSGNNKGLGGITAPACGENVTSVGSVDDSDSISGYNTAPILSLLAPGSSIISTVLSSSFGTKSGTSMAAPHVAGAAALVLEYNRRAYGMNLTAFAVRDKLRRTGTLIQDSRNSIYYPRIDLLKAIQPFINYTASSPANATTISTTSATINITSDVNLSSAILEWHYVNGTNFNYSMTAINTTNYQQTISSLAGGNHTYLVYGNDTVNTFGTSILRTIIVDSTPPTITFNNPLNGSYKKQYFNLNISLSNQVLSFSNYSVINSTGSGLQNNLNTSIATATFSWTDLLNLSNSTFNDDNYTLLVFVNDSIGNSLTQQVTFALDKTAPLLFGVNLTSGIVYNTENVTFRINATDKYLNVSAIYLESNFSGALRNYTLNRETGDLYNYTLFGANNLTNQENVSYRFYASDLVGNINVSDQFSFLVQNRVPVNVNITAPVNGSIIEIGTSTSFTSTATDYDSDTLNYYWTFGDGNSSSSQNPSYAYSAIGTYTLFLNVSDSYSTNNTNITVFTNDTKAPLLPSVSYFTEQHLSRNGNNQTVTATAYDPLGISTFSLFYNSSLISKSCATQNNTHWVCSWSWNSSTVGSSYSFTLNATDGFTTPHTNSTTYTYSVTSCSDSTKNGDETGTDCGGSCTACPAPSSSSSSSGGGGGGGGGGSVGAAIASAETPAESAPAPSGTEAAASAGGGEGGAGAAEPAPETAVAPPVSFTKTVNFVKRESQDILIDNAKIAITGLKIETKVNKEVNLEVTYYPQKPEEATELKNVYQYLKIETGLQDKEIESAVLTFSVPQSWLKENNYLPETVQLNHFDAVDEQWEELDTKLLITTEEALTFEAEAEGFSYFAITASTEMEQSWLRMFIPPKAGTKALVLFGIIIMIIVLIIVYLLVREGERD
ncbi:MAG TPA: S8 family serine peptidase [Candidatus Nanoarchaeia archaeon]|nr:S8 family serine peptidase [Candidatus Nanoarchaeia archaeon]